MHTKQLRTAGTPLDKASRALILLHGRGATAEDIMTLGQHFRLDDVAIIAPQATNYTWYPYSFLAPPSQNEPWLSSALALLMEIVDDVKKVGFHDRQIYIAGFSQGACLSLEFATRNARRWGGIAAFTGGLIGDKLYTENYSGDFGNTPVFIGTSDPDPHVPVARVRDSEAILRSMNANVTVKVYPQMGHTIIQDEIDIANRIVFADVPPKG